jgi:hypothetical protein
MSGRYAERWDRTLLLNLTFWGQDEGGDILLDVPLGADVVCHIAWHHLAARAFVAAGERPSAEALFLGEAIASAFDLYLVGRLLPNAPECAVLESQVPAMADTAAEAGLDPDAFEARLARVADAPEQAFESLRALLFDATRALYQADSAEAGFAALAAFDEHPYAFLLHRFELSNWVLYARAYAATGADPSGSAAALRLDEELRAARDSLALLTERWVLPAS